MATASTERRSFGVFWDIENCRVPTRGSARELVRRIRDRLYERETDREAEFMCVCDASKENKELMKELNSAQVTIVHVDATNKNAADEKLRQRMRYFVETHRPPATVVLISGDVNFEGLLSDIQHRHQLDAILIHPDRINEGLRQCVQQRILYPGLTKDLPSRQTPAKPVGHEIIIRGLPCDRDVKAISARLHQLSENCGGRVTNVTPPRAWLRFKDKELAERAKGRMNGEDVFGSKIRVEVAGAPDHSLSASEHNNGYGSPKSKSGRKKLRKRRGNKSPLGYHSSDGSGNSPQSSPQGSPKGSPFRQRSPAVSNLSRFGTLSPGPDGGGGAGGDSSPHTCDSPGQERRQYRPQDPTLSNINTSRNRSVSYSGGKVTAIHPFIAQTDDAELATLPWNQRGKDHGFSTATTATTTGTTPTPTEKWHQMSNYGEPSRRGSQTPNFVLKKNPIFRTRTYSDPPLGGSGRFQESAQVFGSSPPRSLFRQPPFSPHSIRETRVRHHSSPSYRRSPQGRRFCRSRSNSCNRSNQSSPSFSEPGDCMSVDTTLTSDMGIGGSPTYLGPSVAHIPPEGRSSSLGSQQGAAYLRITNLDIRKDMKDLKDELRKLVQRHTKVEDVSVDRQADGSLVGMVRITNIMAANRAISKLNKATRIGNRKISVSLATSNTQNQSVTSKPQINLKAGALPTSTDPLTLIHGQVTSFSSSSTAFVTSTPPILASTTAVTSSPAQASAPSIAVSTKQIQGICTIHCHQDHPRYATTIGRPNLPLSRVLIKTLAAKVHTLLLGHNGALPVQSFMQCYESEFSPLETGGLPSEGFVPLEHLITCVPGVNITRTATGSHQVEWLANQDQGMATACTMTLDLALEVTTVLDAVPSGVLPLADFPRQYLVIHGKPLNLHHHRHYDLHQLMLTIPNIVQVRVATTGSVIIKLVYGTALIECDLSRRNQTYNTCPL